MITQRLFAEDLKDAQEIFEQKSYANCVSSGHPGQSRIVTDTRASVTKSCADLRANISPKNPDPLNQN
jgi:hypothetical protein